MFGFGNRSKKRMRKFNVFSSGLHKMKLIIVITISFVVVTMMLVTSIEKTGGVFGSNYKEHKYFTKVERPVISATNADGTANGLNLLLIDSIATEGFVKEYLTIARDSQEGKISTYEEHAPVESIIGLAMGEEGGYEDSGFILPLTCLPWDSSNNSPLWDKEKGITLSNATMPVFNRVGHEEKAWRVGNYVSPYQQTESYFSSLYKPSLMLGEGMSAGRTTGDWSYFPDQLAGLDHEYCNIDGIDASQLDPRARLMITSENHNVGESWKTQFLGTYKNGADLTEGVKALSEEFITQFEKHQSDIGSKVVDPSMYKWIASFLLMENGWYVNERSVDYTSTGQPSYVTMTGRNANVCLQAFTMLGLGSTKDEMLSYLDAHKKEPDNWGKCLNASTQGTLWKDFGADGNMYMLVETAGHILSSSFMGPIYYARMLKFAGVDVDPTNPSTYMNTISNTGEWVPSGDTDWLAQNGVDLSQLNEKRFAILNEGCKLIGVPYVYGGNTPPKKNADGTYQVETGALDCSSFVQYTINTAIGVDVSRSTYSQRENENISFISQAEAKPGDLVYKVGSGGNEHVVFFLKDNGDGTILALHEPRTGESVKIGIYPINGAGNTYYFARVKGVD